MQSIGEFFSLIFTAFKVLKWNFKEEKFVKDHFYYNDVFTSVDKVLKKTYQFNSPFLISKRFLQKRKEEDIHCYGETPISSLDIIAKKISLSNTDHFLDLGSGRSRGLFFLSAHYGCRATGVERIPEFVLKSYDISRKFPHLPLKFYLSDIKYARLNEASVIYLYGICLNDDIIEDLAQKMQTLSKDVKIITVSFPLTDYYPFGFSVIDKFPINFNWGSTDVFVQIPSK